MLCNSELHSFNYKPILGFTRDNKDTHVLAYNNNHTSILFK